MSEDRRAQPLDDDRWRRLLADPDAARALQGDPDALAGLLARAAVLDRAHAELQAEHGDLVLLHEATLDHANEIEELLAVKIEQVEALVVGLEVRNAFIREVFGRYITDEVVNTLLASPDGLQLGGARKTITIVMSDLRGFSTLCEGLGPEQVVAILNIYLGAMAEVIAEYRGSINEFIGDAILAVFGAPAPQDDHPERAVACALAMQRAMADVNAQLAAQSLPALEMGIGVHTGEVVVGNIGSAKRAKYGIVGRHVNLASRIESYTIGGQVLISARTASAIGDRLRVRGWFEARPKGVRDPITIYDVCGLEGPLAIRLDEAPVRLRTLARPEPVTFTVLEGKDAGGLEVAAQLCSVDDQHNAELLADVAPQVRTDLKLALDALPGVEAYAKVLAGADGRFRVRFTALPRPLAEALDALPAREETVTRSA